MQYCWGMLWAVFADFRQLANREGLYAIMCIKCIIYLQQEMLKAIPTFKELVELARLLYHLHDEQTGSY
jgi:hypothetical protein